MMRENISTLERVVIIVGMIVAIVFSTISIIITFQDRPPGSRPILDIIESEAVAALDKDIDKAVSLYSEDAFVRDVLGEIGKKLGTVPPDEWTSWCGHDEIRERYRNLPRFTALSHAGAVLTFDDTKKVATVIASTDGIYEDASGTLVNIFSIDGERWTFKKIEGVWKITNFSYNVQ